MNKLTSTQAQSSLKALQAESSSLTPSTLISLYEIDLTNSVEAKGLTTLPFATDRSYPRGLSVSNTAGQEAIFRFHNNVKLLDTTIYFDVDKEAGNPPNGGQLKEFIPAPIEVNGLEITAKGTQPTPTLGLSVSDEGIGALAVLKDIIRAVGDLSGSKFTRIRTYLKYLPPQNFTNNINENYDPYVELPRDIYYIDRKSNENKNSIEFELATLLDLEGIELPLRTAIGNRCMWLYRGEGCEFTGKPIADTKDEYLTSIIGGPINDRGAWERTNTYNKGDSVYVSKTIGGRSVPFYFVAHHDNTTSYPTLLEDWIPEQCSKSIGGCRLRFPSQILPYGGFPSINRNQ